MAEWLRRVIRNHLGSSRVGSNPAHSVLLRSYQKPNLSVWQYLNSILPNYCSQNLRKWNVDSNDELSCASIWLYFGFVDAVLLVTSSFFVTDCFHTVSAKNIFRSYIDYTSYPYIIQTTETVHGKSKVQSQCDLTDFRQNIPDNFTLLKFNAQ